MVDISGHGPLATAWPLTDSENQCLVLTSPIPLINVDIHAVSCALADVEHIKLEEDCLVL